MTERPKQSTVVGPPPPRRAALKIAAVLAGLLSLLVLAMVLLGFGPSRLGLGQAPPTSDADPYIRDFANDLSGEVHSPLPTPETFSHGPNIDGCDRGYGVRGECVPYNFPSGVADTPEAKCAWLASHQFRALEVPGEDRHGLVPPDGPQAPSGNPYACPNDLPLDGVGE